ncbi:GNAT family N-acetyltransferase [Gryllotalpicola reticulitermitis]|uniref:GNAT family N-acetyltransferase n=1 Tax=Gryllotalpicola reticulitermitis TaxID=1184153 RepID=A0ABV8Q995_9MICO
MTSDSNGAFTLRAATPSDSEAIDQLSRLSADGGAVPYRLHTHARVDGDGLTRSHAVVAVAADDGSVIGSARLTIGECRYEGEYRPYGMLGSLVVHPDHRRHGVAASLARWRIDEAERSAGPDVVVLADIQRGNTGSTAAARRWATAFTEPCLTTPTPMLTRAPRPPRGFEIRSLRDDELPEAAIGATMALADYNFARTWTPASLGQWLGWAPTGPAIHHYRVAVSPSGAILAGIALRQEGLLRTMEILRMPRTMRLANTVLRVVPKDGMLRNLAVEHFWFTPGRLEAARALWNDTRWTFRDRGSNLLITVDRRNPILPVLGVRPWTPTTSITTAVRAAPPLSPDRLVAPLE